MTAKQDIQEGQGSITQETMLQALKEARTRLEAVEQAKAEPIAVIGLGCRFPGGANDPETFWSILQQGVDTVTEVPPDRWKVDDYYDPDPEAPGKMYTRYGAFLQQPIEQFDAEFFRISPREAVRMDPQQRLLLEVSWEALEHAGQAPDQLRRSRTGVFVGLCWDDYAERTRLAGREETVDQYSIFGTLRSFTVGRISYVLGLQGPSIQVDTACSSSLVAVHLACQSLRSKECDMALAGGINLLLSPLSTLGRCKTKALSPDGRCKTFDTAADGYGQGEGCGVVVLKRLSDAVVNNDQILALVRGSAINHDGPSSGLTVPNEQAQEDLIRQALKNARVKPEQIQYVEAHGTGTSLGDPIEVGALDAVFGNNHSQSNPLLIGSVKTNIGHLEGAAGIACFIKLVLALQREEIPPHLHFHNPNPHIDWDHLPIRVTTQKTPWPCGEKLRLGGVSSFGMSGTNAHVILEEAPLPQVEPTAVERPVNLLTLSAKTEAALQELVQKYIQYLQVQPEEEIANICFTANTGRAHYQHRIGVLGESIEELAKNLQAFSNGQLKDLSGLVFGKGRESVKPKIAFLCSGHGSPYVGMGRELYETQPTFRRTLSQCAEILDPFLDESLLDILYPGDGSSQTLVNKMTDTQPILFALEYSLAQLWIRWGIQPAFLIGQGVGELVAACLAGVFTLEDGLRLCVEYGKLLQSLARLDHLLPTLEKLLRQISFGTPTLPLVSWGRGKLSAAEVTTPKYWFNHLCQMHKGPQDWWPESSPADLHYLEVSPQAWLLDKIRSPWGIPNKEGIKVASLQPPLSDWTQLLQSLAQLYVHGVNIDWQEFEHGYGRRRVAGLPTYPFQRQSYWLETPPVPRTYPVQSQILHPLLGRHLPLAIHSREIVFESRISLEDLPYLRDHRLFEQVIFPGAAYVEMAVAAGVEILKSASISLENVAFDQPLLLSPEQPKTLQLILNPIGSETYSFEICSLDHPLTQPLSWRVHVTGKIKKKEENAHKVPLAPPSVQEQSIDPTQFYQQAETWGIVFGPSFQSLSRATVTPDESQAQISLPPLISRAEAAGYYLHPVLLDGTFQLSSLLWTHPTFSSEPKDPPALYLPVGIEQMHINGQAGEQWWARAQARSWASPQQETFSSDLNLVDDDGRQIATVQGLTTRRVTRQTFWRSLYPHQQHTLYHLRWHLKGLAPSAKKASTGTGHWLVFVPCVQMEEAWTTHFHRQNDTFTWVYPGDDFQQLNEDHFQVNPLDPSHFRQVLQSCWANDVPLQGIIHLWSVAYSPQPLNLGSLQHAEEWGCGAILHLLQALSAKTGPTEIPLWLVTKGSQAVTSEAEAVQVQSVTLWGLGRVIPLEYPELFCRCLDLDPAASLGEDLLSLAAELMDPDGEDQLAYRQGQRYVARLLAYPEGTFPQNEFLPIPHHPCQLKLAGDRDLDHLGLQPLQRSVPGPLEVEVEVKAVGLNFRDILNALGMLQDNTSLQEGMRRLEEITFGFECTGQVVRRGEQVRHLEVGDEVLVLLATAALSSYVIAPANLVVIKPQQVTSTEAATLAGAFLTAYYGLVQLAQLQPGETVLIHAAAGGVGLAAVQVAQLMGARVLATASSPKWDFLRSQGVEQIMNSRTLDFAAQVMELTDGRGVDVILNSLTGAFIPANLEVMAVGGRLIELSKIGIWTKAEVQQQRPDISYFPFDLREVGLANPSLIQDLWSHLQPLLTQGRLQPLRHQVYDLERVREAFRLMQQGKHIGKLVIHWPTPPETLTLHPQASYLITGGLGALGLQVAKWLVEHGARHLVLCSRHSPSPQSLPLLQTLQEEGAHISILAADLAQEEETRQLLQRIATDLPPLRGIVHAAGVLGDGMLAEQSWAEFHRVLAPKVEGAWNLHQLTQGQDLDFFVCYSSMASLLGSLGQGNYAAANAFLDGLAHYRRSRDQKGLSINWGPWAGAGMATRLSQPFQNRLAAAGMKFIDRHEGLAILQRLLTEQATQVGVLPVEWNRFANVWLQGRSSSLLLLEHLLIQERSPDPSPSQIWQQLQLAPADQQRHLLILHVQQLVARVLSLSDPKCVHLHQPLFELGIDSLMAIELRNSLQRSFAQPLRATLLFDYPTVATLVNHLSREVLGDQIQMLEEDGLAEEKPLPQVSQLTPAETEAAIAQELADLEALFE
jgi:acyl transferase domain-containing protein/acyl carrier protein